MIVKEKIKVPIAVVSKYLDSNLDSYITNRLKEILIMKAIDNLGIVIDIDEKTPLTIEDGTIQTNGICKFEVTVCVTFYKPIIGEKIKCKTKDIGMHGYYATHGPINDIFIATESTPTVKDGQSITVEITRVKFSENKFTVLGKQIKRKTNKK